MKHQQNETHGAPSTRTRRRRFGTALVAALGAGALLAAGLVQPQIARATAAQDPLRPTTTLSAAQRATLLGIAKDTWKFFEKTVDPNTHLPLDNLGPGETKGTYTSAANIGVYLQSVVAANDLKIISRPEARSLI
ncbi:MAG: hypothetical protein H7290_18125, partial [Flavobacterium sp.]|nr:hypothetical protein [Aeromicrobium sp.]